MPGSAGRVRVGDGVEVEMTAGVSAAVWLAATLAVENLLRTNPEAGDTGKQADNKKASKSRIPGKLRGAMLNPLDECPFPLLKGLAQGLGRRRYRNTPVRWPCFAGRRRRHPAIS